MPQRQQPNSGQPVSSDIVQALQVRDRLINRHSKEPIISELPGTRSLGRKWSTRRYSGAGLFIRTHLPRQGRSIYVWIRWETARARMSTGSRHCHSRGD